MMEEYPEWYLRQVEEFANSSAYRIYRDSLAKLDPDAPLWRVDRAFERFEIEIFQEEESKARELQVVRPDGERVPITALTEPLTGF